MGNGRDHIIHKSKGAWLVFIVGVVLALVSFGRPESTSHGNKSIESNNSNNNNTSITEKNEKTETTEEASESNIPEYLYDENLKGLTPDNPATNRVEYKETLLYLILNGVESPVYLYFKGLNDDDIRLTSEYSDHTYYRLSGRELYDEDANGVFKAKLAFEYKQGYYAYMNIMKGIAIPEGEEKAAKVAEVVKEFMDTYIDDSMSDYKKEKAIYKYLAENVAYGDENAPSESDQHTPYGALVDHVAVCNGYSKAFDLMARCCGLEVDYVRGRSSEAKPDEPGHAWNMIKLNGEWYHVDVTWGDTCVKDFEYKDFSYGYFNLNDEQAKQALHVWDPDSYHVATGEDFNFYKINERLYNYNEFCEFVRDHRVSGNLLECSVTDYDSRYDINSIISGYGYNGSWHWCVTNMNSNGYCTIYIYFD